ncbi:MAG: glycosyltransferase family 9 protein [Candidatus Omnitrophica bacterium]|nr:glycosyltransferase family 9 protein [Candidatus Omnitrophota bacterium]
MYRVKNILIVRTDRMGDVILTIPAIRALDQTFPLARISLWVDQSTKDLVEGLPFIDEVIIEDRAGGWWSYFRHVAALRRKKFDLAIIYHTKKRNNMACFLAGIPHRLGYKNNKFGFLLTQPIVDDRHLGTKHEAEYCLDLLKAIGVKGGDLELQLALHEDAEVWAERFFIDHKLVGSPVIAFHPSASCPTRFWPIDFYADLASRIIRQYKASIIIVGGKTAQPAAGKIMAHAGCRVIDLTGQTSLSQLTSILKRCRMLISNDSGPVHMGAAVGIPVISLFLRSQPGINPQRWRPLGQNSILLQNKKGEEILLDPTCKVVSGRFDSISTEEVFSKVEEVFLKC